MKDFDLQLFAGGFSEGDDSVSLDSKLTGSTISALGGNDSIYFSYEASLNSIDLGSGNDSIYVTGNATSNTISAGDGNDSIYFGYEAASNTIDAGDGNDSIYFSYEASLNSIDLGSGNDSIYVTGNATSNTIDAGDGDDSIYFNQHAVSLTIDLGSGDDSLYFFMVTQYNSIDAGAGDDSIVLRQNASSNTIYAGDGNDSISFDYPAIGNVIDAGSGSDLVYIASATSNTIDAGNGNDTLYLDGLALHNSINADIGSALISINGNAEYNTINAGSENDEIYFDSDATSNMINAGSGDDSIHFNYTANSSTINAGDRNDTIYVDNEANNNSIDAGSGNDLLRFNYPVNSNSMDLGAGSDSVYFSGDANSNTIDAGIGDDSIYVSGNANSNSIDAGDGSNTIYVDSKATSNTINTGAGNDSFYVGNDATSNIIDAGSGDDSLFFSYDATSNTIDLGSGNDSIYFNSSANSNTIDAGDGDDSIYFNGNATSNMINTGAGNDSILFNGNATSNTIDAGDGSDIISVISGSGVIDGGSGADQIYLATTYVTIVGSGDISQDGSDGSIWTIGEDSIYGLDVNDAIINAEDNLYRIIKVGNYFSLDGSTATKILRGSISTDYDDTIYAENLSTSIDAGDGSDIISVMSGSGVIDGGSGSDLIYLGTTDVTIVGSGEISQDGSIWTIGEDSILGLTVNDSIVSAGDDQFSIAHVGNHFSIDGATSTQILRGSISTDYDDTIYAENLSTSIDAGAGSDIISVMSGSGVIDGGSGSDLIYLGTTDVTIVGSGDISQDGPDGSIWTIGEDSIYGLDVNDAIINAEDNLYRIIKVGNYFSLDGSTATKILRGSISTDYDDTIYAENLSTSIDAGDGSDIIAEISLGGGASDDDPESGNTFYAMKGESVSSAADQAVITITDVSFNASDVLKVDAGIANLTADFFGTGKFYNYANAEEASTAGVYSNSVLDASALVASYGMSFSMLRMADGTESLDDENAVNESSIVNVVWANTGSAATIDFHESQDDEVLIFTDTNSKGDIISLGGDYNDTIHAGKNDTIDAGGGNDLIYLDGNRAHVIFGNSEGNDTIYGWNSTDYLEFDSMPNVSIVGGDLYLENENGTLLIDGSFTNSTNILYSDGILRVGNSNGDVIYDKNVTYYAGSNLILDTSRGTSIDLSSSTYENISMVDASNGRGRDVFRYTSDAGNVTISNGDSRDVVDLSSYTIDELSTEFTDSGLIISIDDSSLNIVGTEMTQFSLASGRYTADFSNQTFNS